MGPQRQEVRDLIASVAPSSGYHGCVLMLVPTHLGSHPIAPTEATKLLVSVATT